MSYEEEHTITRMIGDTTETIKVLCLWPDIDIYIQQEFIRDGKVIHGASLDINLDTVDRVIALLQKVRDEVQSEVDEYVRYCKESEMNADTNNIEADTDDFEILQLDSD